MPPGTALLELWPQPDMWRLYEHTAQWAGLSYRSASVIAFPSFVKTLALVIQHKYALTLSFSINWVQQNRHKPATTCKKVNAADTCLGDASAAMTTCRMLPCASDCIETSAFVPHLPGFVSLTSR